MRGKAIHYGSRLGRSKFDSDSVLHAAENMCWISKHAKTRSWRIPKCIRMIYSQMEECQRNDWQLVAALPADREVSHCLDVTLPALSPACQSMIRVVELNTRPRQWWRYCSAGPWATCFDPEGAARWRSTLRSCSECVMERSREMTG